MPELPEVETIRQRLIKGFGDRPSILNQTIQQARLLWPVTLANAAGDYFEGFVKGQKVLSVNRRAKFLYLTLSDAYLVFHLRMSGDLFLEPVGQIEAHPYRYQQHDRVWLDFESGWRLVFNDIRKFGRMWLLNDLNTIFAQIGPEPLDDALTPEVFHQNLISKSRQLKPLLLDQSFIAGVGNIYSDEALFLAGLHPLRKSDCLTLEDATRLLDALRAVLTKGIDQKGASIDWVYRGGDFQNYFQVYQQQDQPCPRCGNLIKKSKVGQRGTHFCPRCQKLD